MKNDRNIFLGGHDLGVREILDILYNMYVGTIFTQNKKVLLYHNNPPFHYFFKEYFYLTNIFTIGWVTGFEFGFPRRHVAVAETGEAYSNIFL